MNRRNVLTWLASLPFVGVLFGKAQAEPRNILIGAKAGSQITTGSHAIAIGRYADPEHNPKLIPLDACPKHPHLANRRPSGMSYAYWNRFVTKRIDKDGNMYGPDIVHCKFCVFEFLEQHDAELQRLTWYPKQEPQKEITS